jgi:hypothetical protein
MNNLWTEEVIHQNKTLNPQLMEIMSDIKEIKEKLK